MVQCDQKILNRLKRTEGQVRGIQKMIGAEADCQDVITQLSAVRASVDRIMGIIVAENLKECLDNPAPDASEQAANVQQAVKLIINK